jgi:hypothetical protein
MNRVYTRFPVDKAAGIDHNMNLGVIKIIAG